jgi:CubicO group peptidase (beta-lactamase class C family)
MKPLAWLSVWLALILIPAPVLAQTPDCAVPAAGDDGWPVATAAAAGLDPSVLCPAGPRFDTWKAANVHAILVVRDGKLVFERYFTGYDEQHGAIVSGVTFDPTKLHDVRSVTKSVTSLVLGIAIGHKWIDSLDRTVLPYFPEYADLRSPERDSITLKDLLTMSAGLKWDEMIPYSDPANSEIAMGHAADPYRFALEQPVVQPAGSVYNYSGGGATLLAAILRKTTGRSLDELARDELFAPLGITDVRWYRFSNGDPRAASGLQMRPRDMAKIGQLILDHGRWGDRQIVPADYIDAAVTPQINGLGLYFYGYQFWLGRSFVSGRPIEWAAAVGLGGQRIFIVPSLRMVVVITAGLYHSDQQSVAPLMILNRYALAAAVAGK